MVKNSPANAKDAGSIPGSERSPEEGNDNQLQYACLENSTDREAWWATVHGDTKSETGLMTEHTREKKPLPKIREGKGGGAGGGGKGRRERESQTNNLFPRPNMKNTRCICYKQSSLLNHGNISYYCKKHYF